VKNEDLKKVTQLGLW